MSNINFGNLTINNNNQVAADALKSRLEEISIKANANRSQADNAVYNFFSNASNFDNKTFEEIKADFKATTGLDLMDVITPGLDSQVVSAFKDRMSMLDAKRKEKLDEVTAFSAKITVLTKIQAELSAQMKGMKDKDETRSVPTHITFTEKEIDASPGLREFLEAASGQKLLTYPVVIDTPKLIGGLVDGLDGSSFNNYKDLSLNDFRSLSESLGNQIKIFNDRTNELTTEYQDFSSKYDATVDAISKFLAQYYQTLSKIQSNTQ